MKDTINFRNRAQQVLYDQEIRGQISDGHWENEDTDTRLWYCLSKVNSKAVGSNWKPEPKLDFADEDLIARLGGRMINYVLDSGVCKRYDINDLQKDLLDMTLIVFEFESGTIKATRGMTYDELREEIKYAEGW